MKNFDEIKLAKELISFPTIKTEDKGIMKFLSKKLSSIGFKCKVVKSKGLGQKSALNLFAKFGHSYMFILSFCFKSITDQTGPEKYEYLEVPSLQEDERTLWSAAIW